MSDIFKIFLDRLYDGKKQILDATIEKETLFLDEAEIKFTDSILVKGKAYLASDHLVIRISAKVPITMPCVICNDPVSFLLGIKDQFYTIMREEIPSRIYCFKDLLRENLLLELPQIKECNGGCKKRAEIAPFLQQDTTDQKPSTHFPFSGIE